MYHGIARKYCIYKLRYLYMYQKIIYLSYKYESVYCTKIIKMVKDPGTLWNVVCACSAGWVEGEGGGGGW